MYDPNQTYMSGGHIVSGSTLNAARSLSGAVIAQLERRHKAAVAKRKAAKRPPRVYTDLVKPPLDADNRCVRCKRIVVGLKPGDLHDHTEQCPDCGRERETPM